MRLHVGGQQLDGGAQAGHGGHQGALDLAAQLGGMVQGPVGRHVHVHIDKAALPGAARGHMVEAQRPRRLALHEALQRGLDGGLHLGFGSLVHQALRRAPDQFQAFLEDVERHQDGCRGIQPQPACEGRAHQTHQHAGRGPDIGDEVARIGLQCDRTVLARGAEHGPGQQPVERRAEHRQPQAPAHLFERLRVEQPVPGRPEDAAGHAHDEQALEARGKVLGLVVAIRVVVVGRQLRHRHHGQGEHCAGEVDEGLHGVRQQAHRTRDVPGQGLERDGEQGHAHRGAQQVGGRQPGAREWGIGRHGPDYTRPAPPHPVPESPP